MPLRLARTTDLPRISNILANAFEDEDVMGKTIHPHLQKYPEDYQRYWLQNLRKWYWDYTNQIVVTYCYSEKPGLPGEKEEVLTGVGAWERQGEGRWRYAGLLGWWDPRNFIHIIVKTINSISRFIFPNRAANPSKINLGDRVMQCVGYHWSGQRANNWYLSFLGVDPAYQRKGYGRELVKWGIDQAKQENIAASVIAGTGKEQFYRLCGYEVEVGKASDGEGNPLNGLTDGGTIMFRDSEKPPER